MTTLEIILICVVVWLVGMVIILWLYNDFQDLETFVIVFFWFFMVPFCIIRGKIQKHKNKKWDKRT